MGFESSLFPEGSLPRQERDSNPSLDLQELDKELVRISSNSGFSYSRESSNGHNIIIAVGKGLTIKFVLDYETQTIMPTEYTDSYATSDGTPTDVAPLALDTEDLIENAKKEIESAIIEVVDPTLIE